MVGDYPLSTVYAIFPPCYRIHVTYPAHSTLQHPRGQVGYVGGRHTLSPHPIHFLKTRLTARSAVMYLLCAPCIIICTYIGPYLVCSSRKASCVRRNPLDKFYYSDSELPTIPSKTSICTKYSSNMPAVSQMIGSIHYPG